MPYKVFRGFDTAGRPIFHWECEHEKCRGTSSSCLHILEAINSDQEDIKLVEMGIDDYRKGLEKDDREKR